MTPNESLDRFHRQLNARHLSITTHSNYHLWVSRFFEYCRPDDVSELTIDDAQDFLLNLSENYDYADRTYNVAVDAIRSFFELVLHIHGSGKEFLKRKVSVVQKNPITPDQALTLLESCQDPMLKAAIALGFGCGMRIEEIVTLKVVNIHKGSRFITIENSKGNKTRTVKYSLSAMEILQNYCRIRGITSASKDSYIFPSEKKSGDHMSCSVLSYTFRNYLQTISFYLPDQTFHGLRHAFATSLANRNVPLPVIQKLMGHQSAATTAFYIHTPQEEPDELPDLLVREK